MPIEALSRPESRSSYGHESPGNVPGVDVQKMINDTHAGRQTPDWDIFQATQTPEGTRRLSKYSPDGKVRVIEDFGTWRRLSEHSLGEIPGEAYVQPAVTPDSRSFAPDVALVRGGENRHLSQGNTELATEFGAKYEEMYRKFPNYRIEKTQSRSQRAPVTWNSNGQPIYSTFNRPTWTPRESTPRPEFVVPPAPIRPTLRRSTPEASEQDRSVSSRAGLPHIESPIKFKNAEERAAYLEETKAEARRLRAEAVNIREKVGSASGKAFDGGIDAATAAINGVSGNIDAGRGWFEARAAHLRAKAGEIRLPDLSLPKFDSPAKRTPDRRVHSSADNPAINVQASIDKAVKSVRSSVSELGDRVAKVRNDAEAAGTRVGDQLERAKANKDRLVASATAGLDRARGVNLPSMPDIRTSLEGLFKRPGEASARPAAAAEAPGLEAPKSSTRETIDTFFQTLDARRAELRRKLQIRSQINFDTNGPKDFIATGLNRVRDVVGGVFESRGTRNESQLARDEFANWNDEDLQEFSHNATDPRDLRLANIELRSRIERKVRAEMGEESQSALDIARESSSASYNSAKRVGETIGKALPDINWRGVGRTAGDGATVLVGGTLVLGALGVKAAKKASGTMIASNEEAARRAAGKINSLEVPKMNITPKIRGGLSSASAGVIKVAGTVDRGVGRVEDKIGEIGTPMVEGLARGIDGVVTPSARAVRESLSQPWVTNVFPNGGEAYVQHSPEEYVEGSNVKPVIREGIDRVVKAERQAVKSTANLGNRAADFVREKRKSKPVVPPALEGELNTQRALGGFPEIRNAIVVGSGEPTHWTPPLGTRTQPSEEDVDPTAETRPWTTGSTRPAPEAPGWSTDTTQVDVPVAVAESETDELGSSVAVEAPPSFDLDDTEPYVVSLPHDNGNGKHGSNGYDPLIISETRALNLSDLARNSSGSERPIEYERGTHGRFVNKDTGLNKTMINEEEGVIFTHLASKNVKPKA